MSPHLWYVALAWGASALVFGGLVLATLLRQRAARRDLAELEGHP
ncbi:heme exporter protein CcmD [Roseomonas sp. OT10]|nr:heme exporter protein CcmD [Roseomonas sp. OT10]UFN48073.1 heme exporter protein CcmD [Roseomonas sp. OT10]